MNTSRSNSPHSKPHEGEGNNEGYSAYASSEITSSSQYRSVSVNATGDEVGTYFKVSKPSKTVIDVILAQLQLLNKNPPHENQNNSKDSDEGASGSGSKDKKDNGSKDKEEDAHFHLTWDAYKVLEDI